MAFAAANVLAKREGAYDHESIATAQHLVAAIGEKAFLAVYDECEVDIRPKAIITGPHLLEVDFTNDAYGESASKDRNLYVKVTYGGKATLLSPEVPLLYRRGTYRGRAKLGPPNRSDPLKSGAVAAILRSVPAPFRRSGSPSSIGQMFNNGATCGRWPISRHDYKPIDRGAQTVVRAQPKTSRMSVRGKEARADPTLPLAISMQADRASDQALATGSLSLTDDAGHASASRHDGEICRWQSKPK